GDFTNDGRLSLAAVLPFDRYIAFLQGNGDGTFQPFRPLPTTFGHQGLAVGDFTGDNRLSIVASCNCGEGCVSYLQSACHGTVQAARTVATAGEPDRTAVGDLNGDGWLDLVVAHFNPQAVSVHLGNGNGTFQPQELFPLNRWNRGVAVGDFNGDRAPDVVVSNPVLSDSLTVLLNEAPTYAVGFVVQAPADSRAGTAFDVTVTVLNQFGAVHAGYRDAVRFQSTDPLAVLPADYTFTAADGGQHTFSETTLFTAGL